MAWIKQKSEPEPASTTESKTPPRAETTTRPAAKREPAQPLTQNRTESIVNIGQSVEIKGELTGNEDLTIEGMVDGKIQVKDHNLTIGANGRIKADVHAKTVIVVGQVHGNITGDDKVEIAPSGSVNGDIKAPKVSISEGAKFRGSIDMSGASASPRSESQTAASTSSPSTRAIVHQGGS